MQRLLTILAVGFSALLAGCTLPWQSSEANEDVGGSYESGVGVALAVRNDGADVVRASLRAVDQNGKLLGEDTMDLEPGQTMVRRYGVAQHVRFTAQMSYAWDQGGKAASGQDSQTLETLGCDELTRLDWTVRALETGIGSQYLGKTCEAADG